MEPSIEDLECQSELHPPDFVRWWGISCKEAAKIFEVPAQVIAAEGYQNFVTERGIKRKMVFNKEHRKVAAFLTRKWLLEGWLPKNPKKLPKHLFKDLN